MRFTLLFLAFLLLVADVSAFTATGYLRLEIINLPPEVGALALSPETIYPDTILSCEGTVIDEQPDAASLDYHWERNGLIAQESGNRYGGLLEPGDTIACAAIATDRHGAQSSEVMLQATVQEPPKEIVQLQQALQALGRPVDTEEAIALRAEGLGAITGHVVGVEGSQASWIGLLAVVAVILVLLNVRLIMLGRIRKTKPLYSSQT